MEILHNSIVCGSALSILSQIPDKSIYCCVTSPPYWGLRDYGVPSQLGLEKTPEEYTAKMVDIFREVRRVLRDDGTLWLNLGDSYAGSWGDSGHRPERTGVQGHQRDKSSEWFERKGHPKNNPPTSKRLLGLKPKDLVGIPWRVAFALQADGWYLRSDIIWHKPNPMPESVTDRPTKAHEYIFLMSKSEKYYYDGESIKEPTNDLLTKPRSFRKTGGDATLRNDTGNNYIPRNTRNKRTVWTVATKPYKGAHFATFPPKLIEPCILAGCPENGIVLDPFIGSGTVAEVCILNNRKYIGIELNSHYISLAYQRIFRTYTKMIDTQPLFQL